MTMFLVERSFEVTEEGMDEVGRRSKRLAIEQYPQITWHHSHVVVGEDGLVKTYCVYEAPNEEIVRAHATSLGQHRLDGVYEIAGDVTPDDFPLT